ncbi:MAG: protein kinase [Candidatus Aminicenantes bacterium]|nr:protein kinase [Candidatus Aminicenantes bacterium]
MKCPKCQHENPDDSSFCGKCGAALIQKSRPPFSEAEGISQEELSKGQSLSGRYRIIEELGRGGMGKVYRAEDASLSRQVAIKILPREFAGDSERLARFKREGKILASLNHSNIATIHGLEEDEGRQFLVMELVEGQTLAERLMKGALPLEEALLIGRQIAEGLQAAHEKGVIHRDLKPANVKITPEGKVKILDFGLAKAFVSDSESAESSPTLSITDRMTVPGIILGTASYMSPEQAKGRRVDRRTDIWALGCILFESLTGRRAFQGETVTEIVAAVLKGEPDWTLLPENTPYVIRTLLEWCLRKDPDLRLHDAADALIAMQETKGWPLEKITMPERKRLHPAFLAGACGLALVVGILIGPPVGTLFHPDAFSSASSPVRTSVNIKPGWQLASLDFLNIESILQTRTEMALSNDGRFLVFSATENQPGSGAAASLFLRRLDKLEAEPVSGTEGGSSPFFSPDGEWLGFWADGKLKKVPVEGGIPIVLCDVPRPYGFSWGTDDRIVFSRDRHTGLFRVSADGGAIETLTVPDRSRGEIAHYLPHCLPGGRGIVFTVKKHYWDLQPGVAVWESKTRKWRTLLENAADARYVPTGHLAFLRQGTLIIAPFSLDKLEITSPPVPAVADIAQALNSTQSFMETAAGQFSLSSTGSLIYASGGIVPDKENSVLWMDAEARVEPAVPFKAGFWSVRLSPDGRRIAYTTMGTKSAVWIHDLLRGTDMKMTTEGVSQWAVWTPDGKRLIFDWLREGVPNIYWEAADGSSPMERLTNSEYMQWPSSISPDGETLAIVEERGETGRDICFLDVRERRITPFLQTRFDETDPQFSPDGKWIAYCTNESGRWEVSVQPFPGSGSRWQISHEGGANPCWAPDGKRLYYRSWRGGNEIWVVDVQTDSGFSAGKPRFHMKTEGYSSRLVRLWDISPDGRRFLAVKEDERKLQPITEMILVQNWFSEVKRLFRAKKDS